MNMIILKYLNIFNRNLYNLYRFILIGKINCKRLIHYYYKNKIIFICVSLHILLNNYYIIL